MSSVKTTPEPRAQSAAAPSPFPPIADYAFLSNCHTGALVAADGAIDWLCAPSFDAPSVFGSLLDREAGFFRFAPFGISHPTARAYIPGTNVLETTWKTPNGWIVVRDALTMGARDHEDQITPHTRPPADDDADHELVRTVEPRGPGRSRARLRAGLRLRARPGGMDHGGRPPHRRCAWSRADHPPAVRSCARCRGRSHPRAARARARRSRLLRALVGRRAGRAAGRRRGGSAAARDHPLLARVAAEVADPRPSVA
jgi:Domain of unknown function (DUF5911)